MTVSDVGAGEIITLAGQFGPMGLIVAYLIWRESAERKDGRDEAEKNRELASKRIETDIELARSFLLLTETIKGIIR